MRHILLPEPYIVRSKYRTHWTYRVTWYVILAGLVVNGLMFFAWQRMYDSKKEAETTAAMLVEAEAILAKKKTEVTPLINKYKELVAWQSYKRVPVAQVLEVLEKNIGRDAGLVSLSWNLTELDSNKRKGKVAMKVFVSEIGGGNLDPETPWLQSVKRALGIYKIGHGKMNVTGGEEQEGGKIFSVDFEVFPREGRQ